MCSACAVTCCRTRARRLEAARLQHERSGVRQSPQRISEPHRLPARPARASTRHSNRTPAVRSFPFARDHGRAERLEPAERLASPSCTSAERRIALRHSARTVPTPDSAMTPLESRIDPPGRRLSRDDDEALARAHARGNEPGEAGARTIRSGTRTDPVRPREARLVPTYSTSRDRSPRLNTAYVFAASTTSAIRSRARRGRDVSLVESTRTAGDSRAPLGLIDLAAVELDEGAATSTRASAEAWLGCPEPDCSYSAAVRSARTA